MRKLSWITCAMLAAVVGLTGTAKADQHDKDHAKPMIATSQIVGSSLYNANDESVATVNDLVFDSRGQLHYAIVGVGGIAGLGQSSVAVPIQAINCVCSKKDDGSKECKMTISMTAERIGEAPKLESDNHSEFTNQSWVSMNNSFFGVDSVERDRAQGNLMLHSKINNVNVKNSGGETAGQLDDVIVSVADHKAKFAVLGTGGVLGLGKTYRALPYSAVQLQQDADRNWQASVQKTQAEVDALPVVTSPDYRELDRAETRDAVKGEKAPQTQPAPRPIAN